MTYDLSLPSRPHYLLNGRSGHRSRQPQDPFSCVQQPENRVCFTFPRSILSR